MTSLTLFSRFSRCVVTLGVLAVPVLAPRTALADEIGPPAAPERAAAPAAAPVTVVELASDDARATIERRVGTLSPSGIPLLETGVLAVAQWESACATPCTVKLDSRYAYRVGGEGLVPTEPFVMPRSADHVRVDARMGSSVGRVAGVVSTGLGIAAIAAGGLACIATPILQKENVGSEGLRTGVLAGGIGTMSVGVIAVGVGAFLWFTNQSTAHAQIACATSGSACRVTHVASR